jgi:hypothetical protein
LDRQSGLIRSGRHILEVLPNDIEPESFVSSTLFPKASMVQTVQNLIWDRITSGTRLSLIPQASGTHNMGILLGWINPATNKPIPLAYFKESFVADLIYFLGTLPDKNFKMQATLKGCFSYERNTIVLPPFVQNIHNPWMETGFCIGLGIKGSIIVD